MKVLMINSVCGVGSTGRICTDIADILKSQGHDCKIAYGRGDVPDKYKDVSLKIATGFGVRLNALKARIFDNEGFNAKRSTLKFIDWIKKYNPDVIHLHNLHGYYLNVKILFDYLKKEYKGKIIWTLHDCWAFTGHCSYFDYANCEKWKNGCEKCKEIRSYPKSLVDKSKKNYDIKKQTFAGVKNLTIVTPSKWLKSLVEKSFLKEYEVNVINNGIDVSVFKPTQSDLKEKYGLQGKKIILGVASVWYKRKGLEDFIKLSKLINDKYKIVLVGVSDKIYKSADKILVTSKAFSEYFKKEFGIESVRYLPQYAENLFSKESCKKKPNGRIDLMFAGNVGVAQSVETIIKAANLTKDLKEVCYHIVGDGSEIEKCKKLARELKINNLFFYGRKTVEEMPKFYSMADAMLLTMQKDKVLSMTIPGKLQSYMAAGKPVIASIDGEANRLITESKTGLTANAEDYEGLSKVIRRFVKDKNKDRYALNSEKYYENHFTKERFFDKLENTLNEGL